MEFRAVKLLFAGLAFMGLAAPVAWLWSIESTWSRSDILALLQTVFSIAALFAALAIAVFEHVRAVRSDERRREQFLALAVALARSAVDALDQICIPGLTDAVARQRAQTAYLMLDAISDAFQGMIASSPPDAELAIGVTALARATREPAWLMAPRGAHELAERATAVSAEIRHNATNLITRLRG